MYIHFVVENVESIRCLSFVILIALINMFYFFEKTLLIGGKMKLEVISFIIPVYASEGTVGLVIDEIKETVKERDGYDYEIIAVDDYSPDHVLSVLRGIAADDTKVKVIISPSINFQLWRRPFFSH